VIDERFNGGGQVADYIIEAMQRRIVGYWGPIATAQSRQHRMHPFQDQR